MTFQIAIRAGILGYFFGISLFVAITMDDRYKSFGIYGAFLTIFHYSEYLVISISNPQSLSLDSFMLTHSIQYGIAAALSWTEYFVEVHFFPGESREVHVRRHISDAIFRHEAVRKSLDCRIADLLIGRSCTEARDAHSQEEFPSHRESHLKLKK